jgi:hypothetical protein
LPQILKELPEEPPDGERYSQLTFLMPWKDGARFRQICHENNTFASVELRKMVIRWIRDYDKQETH